VSLGDRVQELRELGVRGTAFRVGWELRLKLEALQEREVRATSPLRTGLLRRLPFEDPGTLAAALRDRISARELEALARVAAAAARGDILCFGKWLGRYGDPIDWFLNPTNGQRWRDDAYWAKSLRDEPRVGDVKLSWEVGRFPHAFTMARAAAFHPESAPALAAALASQIDGFRRANPPGRGIHWASGQEGALRGLAWLFATDVLLSRRPEGSSMAPRIAASLADIAQHIEHVIPYAKNAVYNNHLVNEALGLYLVGVLVPELPDAERWRIHGQGILDQEADRQVYADGGYIQLSHNYHRGIVQSYLWACLLARTSGDRPSAAWIRALDRSITFLHAHQNPTDGRLPNFGPNDGAHFSVLACSDFADFRPTLQAASCIARGERLYDAGPWDEEAAWFWGVAALDLPLRRPAHRSFSFGVSGFHVLRDRDPRSFATLRCGSLLDRFSQIDMLHVDVWWRGLNVAIDGGTYLYNGPQEWHEHFLRTGSHNTVVIDGRDQMLHIRRFKVLYPTQARLHDFHQEHGLAVAAGEHHAYARHAGGCVHQRALLLLDDETTVVVDRILGAGAHDVRLHWLLGGFPYRAGLDGEASLTLDTPEGPYEVAVHHEDGGRARGTIACGQEDPPRGWESRYYATKVPVPSLVVEAAAALPLTFVTLLGPAPVRLEASTTPGRYTVRSGERAYEIDLLERRLVPPARGAA
jgi:asparagine synthase (glutamine-hydrolysing)